MAAMVRRATMDDYDAVMAITAQNQIYFGIDYLPVEFEKLVNQADYDAFVLLVDDLIVGFLGCQVTSGGKSLLTRAGRVKPDYRGRGFYKLLSKRSLEMMKLARPTLTTTRMTVEEGNAYYERLMETQRIVYKGNICYFRKTTSSHESDSNFHLSTLNDDNDDDEQKLTHFISRDTWSRLLANADCRERLAPSGNFVVHWHIYEFDPEELNGVEAEHKGLAYLVSGRRTSGRERGRTGSKILTDEEGPDGDNGHGEDDDELTVEAATICCKASFGFNNETKLNLDCYGDFSVRLFRRHLRRILAKAADEGLQFRVLQVHVPPEREHLLRIVTEEFGFEDFWNMTFCGFETNI